MYCNHVPSSNAYWAPVPAQFLACRSYFKECRTSTPEELELFRLGDEMRLREQRLREQVKDEPVRVYKNQDSTFAGEFPDDILSVIREFSRPLLRYPREYKEALQELDLHEWTALKAKLSTDEAFYILKFLQSYLEAHRKEVKAKQFHLGGGSSYPWVKAYRDKLRIYNELLAKL